eukprot:Colp12_sorted_trinity150504_noHs@4566
MVDPAEVTVITTQPQSVDVDPGFAGNAATGSNDEYTNSCCGYLNCQPCRESCLNGFYKSSTWKHCAISKGLCKASRPFGLHLYCCWPVAIMLEIVIFIICVVFGLACIVLCS